MEIPLKVSQIMTRYQELLARSLPNRLSGLYIVGSIAFGAYIDGKSDIDFITVVDRCLNSAEMSEAVILTTTLTLIGRDGSMV